jgi:hypothetical protein
MREWRSDQTGTGANDQLLVNGSNVLAAPIAPRVKRILAVFNLDRGSDGVSDHSAIVSPFNLIPSFLTGTDTYIPASPDAGGTVKVVEKVRSPFGHVKQVNIPNWPSTDHSLSVYFKDYPALKYKAKKVRKCVRVKARNHARKTTKWVKRCRIKRVDGFAKGGRL